MYRKLFIAIAISLLAATVAGLTGPMLERASGWPYWTLLFVIIIITPAVAYIVLLVFRHRKRPPNPYLNFAGVVLTFGMFLSFTNDALALGFACLLCNAVTQTLMIVRMTRAL